MKMWINYFPIYNNFEAVPTKNLQLLKISKHFQFSYPWCRISQNPVEKALCVIEIFRESHGGV